MTNLAQYAIKGYEVDALDFMVKPVSFSGVAMCMDKVMRFLRRRVERHILVETRRKAHVVSLTNLVYVMVTNHRLVYRLADSGEPLRTRGSLRSVEKELLDAPFVLISSSCIVNMSYIRSYRGNVLRLANGETLYFSGPKRRMATEKIASFFGGSI